MANSKKAVAVTAIIACASLLLVAVILNSLVAGGMVIRDIETSEHADEAMTILQLSERERDQSINLNGYWKKSTVTVSFIPQQGMGPRLDESIAVLEATMQVPDGEHISNSTRVFVGWPDLLATLSERTNVPLLRIIEHGSESADIRVYLKEESHPENKLGLARIARDKATYEIVYAEVHIYSVLSQQREGILAQVFKHELGHALGIGHATAQVSIMHSPIIIVNGDAIGDIRDCEVESISYLYSGGPIREFNCSL